MHCRDGQQTAVFDHDCGAELHAQVVCAACARPVAFGDLTVVGGTHQPVIVSQIRR